MNDNRRAKLQRVLAKRQPDLTVLLENVEDPHNIAAVLRTCDSVGVQEIYVVDTKETSTSAVGYRSSAGSYKWLPVHRFSSLQACLAVMLPRYPLLLATHMSPRSSGLYEVALTQPLAIAFGNEYHGCSPELVAAAHGTLHIPQVGMVQSLNISVACAVVLYEAFRQKKAAGHYDAPRLSDTEQKEWMLRWGDYALSQQP